MTYYINQRPDGKYEAKAEGAERASKVFDTQKEAQDWVDNEAYGGDNGKKVRRVRETENGKPGQFR